MLNTSPGVNLNKFSEAFDAYLEPFSLFLIGSFTGYNMRDVMSQLENYKGS